MSPQVSQTDSWEAISKYLLNEWMNELQILLSVAAKLWVWKLIMKLLSAFPSDIGAVGLSQYVLYV